MNAFYIVLIVVAAAVIAAVAADIVLLYRSKVAADRPEYEKCREVYNAYHNAFKLTVAYAILCALLLTTLFPFFWMITSSLKTTKEVMAEKFIVFPETPIWSNYARVFQKFDIMTGLKNTMIIEIATVPICIFMSGLEAFAFAKMPLRHKKFWLIFFLSGMMFPYASVLLPQFRIYRTLNMLNTLWPMILPSLFGTVGTMFFFVQIMSAVPSAIIEASRIDGAGWFRCYCAIMIPMIPAAIATQIVFSFVGAWNDFFAPSIYLTKDSVKTLQLMLYTYGAWADKNILFAASAITCLPLFIVYFIFQKYFVGSMATAAVKG